MRCSRTPPSPRSSTARTSRRSHGDHRRPRAALTSEPEALRAIFRDVFGWKHVDDGHGWLIFALPPSELGVHPAEGPTLDGGSRHQLTLMCDDLDATVEELRSKGVEVRGEPEATGWGIATTLVLPGGVEMMLYQPRHQTAI